jgi:hypothetical protein
MTPDQSRACKPKDRVSWQGAPGDQGTITNTDWSGVQIDWDSGKSCFYHHNNMGDIQPV